VAPRPAVAIRTRPSARSCARVSIRYAGLAVPLRSPVARLSLVATLWLSALGCFVDLPTDDPLVSPCVGLTCSSNGHCDDGVCYCDPSHVGNPYALHGCQPTGALSPCETTCGLNAYCDAGSCRCAEGSVAVCGTGDCVGEQTLCDGTADCANAADEDPLVCYEGAVQEWALSDRCDDGADVRWRVWAQERDWVWPGPDDTFVSEGYDRTSRQSIECLAGELLCFGGESGDSVWGVGLDGRGSCDDCCQPCASEAVDVGALRCE